MLDDARLTPRVVAGRVLVGRPAQEDKGTRRALKLWFARRLRRGVEPLLLQVVEQSFKRFS